jgi:hypothetical protein
VAHSARAGSRVFVSATWAPRSQAQDRRRDHLQQHLHRDQHLRYDVGEDARRLPTSWPRLPPSDMGRPSSVWCKARGRCGAGSPSGGGPRHGRTRCARRRRCRTHVQGGPGCARQMVADGTDPRTPPHGRVRVRDDVQPMLARHGLIVSRAHPTKEGSPGRV